MKLSEYLLTSPYYLFWKVKKLFDPSDPVIDFYIGEMMDYFIMEPVIRKFPQSRIVAKNAHIKKELESLGVAAISWPSFPDVVIMARHAMHEFPIDNVIKIGMAHGVYQFKKFIKAKKYNVFQRFFMTSQEHMLMAEKIGVKCGVAIGCPKLDQAFNGEIDDAYLEELKTSLHLDPAKPTVMFSATWDKSGMSAIHLWHERIEELSDTYNVMVTLHPFMSKRYTDNIRGKKSIIYIDSYNTVPYLMLADVLVSDTSSIIGEYCAFNKPIVSFKVDTGTRLTEDIKELISSISISVQSFDEAKIAIEKSLSNDTLGAARKAANKKFFYALDGKAADRAAEEIVKVLQENNLHTDTSLVQV
ncbi:MAG: CDP-glycerol glycerophosphotransferase family protein [Imperialibacter sp.]|uniref:CDP-glycerol glycerophosphotransferase family protein n=1 Tax=Imperialibacter sp. TaxID=2038411 RepID=UPI003A8A306C